MIVDFRIFGLSCLLCFESTDRIPSADNENITRAFVSANKNNSSHVRNQCKWSFTVGTSRFKSTGASSKRSLTL